MDKNELTAHLREVTGAEYAVYLIDGARSRLKSFRTSVDENIDDIKNDELEKTNDPPDYFNTILRTVISIVFIILAWRKTAGLWHSYMDGSASWSAEVIGQFLLWLGAWIVSLIGVVLLCAAIWTPLHLIGALIFQKSRGSTRKKALSRLNSSDPAMVSENALIKVLDRVSGELLKSREKLDRQRVQLYKKSVLPKKYRDYASAEQLLAYLETGECVQLKGSGGALKRLRADRRAGKAVRTVRDYERLIKNSDIRALDMPLYEPVTKKLEIVSRLDDDLIQLSNYIYQALEYEDEDDIEKAYDIRPVSDDQISGYAYSFLSWSALSDVLNYTPDARQPSGASSGDEHYAEDISAEQQTAEEHPAEEQPAKEPLVEEPLLEGQFIERSPAAEPSVEERP